MTPPRLALDWSSLRLSVALQTEAGLTSSHQELDRFDGPAALGLVESLLNEAHQSLEALQEIRIGVGPGNFSGIRLSLAWSFGAAAPGGIALRAFSSLELLTARLLSDGQRDFVLLGDARRGQWWGRVVRDSCPGPLERLLPGDWEALAGDLPRHSPDVLRLPAHPKLHALYPDAADLLRLTLPEVEAAPLYLHGAVAD